MSAHLTTPRTTRPKHPGRRAMEAVLAEAAQPLDIVTLASLAGISKAEARRHIVNIMQAGGAYNTLASNREALYACGPAPTAIQAPGVAGPRATSPMGTSQVYDGAHLRPYAGRPGAMDAFTLPSLQRGERTPRVRPVLLGAIPVKKV